MMTSHSHIDIEIRDSLQENKLYHFKVPKLETHEDRKQNNSETPEETDESHIELTNLKKTDESSKVTLMFSFVFPK